MKRITGYDVLDRNRILISFFLPGTFSAVVLTAFLLIVGYCLFCG